MKPNEQGNTYRKALPLLLAATCSTDIDEIPLDYHQVKASYLFNLLRFIDWPADACPSGGILNLYVYGAESLDAFHALHRTRVGNRHISVQRARDLSPERISKAHLLFISSDRPVTSVPIARGLLTVGETRGFTAAGGIVNLMLVNGHVRFQLNEEVALACGLVISPQLLKLQVR